MHHPHLTAVLAGAALAVPALAQTPAHWIRHMDAGLNQMDWISAVAHGPAGTVSAAGSATDSYNSHAIFTLRYDCQGQQLFTAAYRAPTTGGFHNDLAVDVGTDGVGNTYTLGVSWGDLRPEGSEFDYVLIKYSPAGQEVWIRRFNGPGNWSDTPTDMTVDNAGNCYISGFAYYQQDLFNRYATDFHVIKYTTDGDIAWQYHANNAESGNLGAGARAVALDPAGNVYATGVINGGDAFNNDDDFLTVKLTSDGQLVYRQEYSSPGFLTGQDDGMVIFADGAGNAYVGGMWMIDDPSSYRHRDTRTLKYSATGQLLWTTSTTRDNEEDPLAITADADGNCYVGGYWFNGSDTNGWIESYSPTGALRWAYIVDEAGDYDENAVTGLKFGADGILYGAADNERPETGGYDPTLLKFAPDGTLLMRLAIDAGSTTDDAWGFDLDAQGNAYIGGYSTFMATSADFLVMKIFSENQPPSCCQADFNGDGFVDGIDYDQFNIAFESQDPGQQMAADFNGDGFVDGIDYDQFNAAFEAGC